MRAEPYCAFARVEQVVTIERARLTWSGRERPKEAVGGRQFAARVGLAARRQPSISAIVVVGGLVIIGFKLCPSVANVSDAR